MNQSFFILNTHACLHDLFFSSLLKAFEIPLSDCCFYWRVATIQSSFMFVKLVNFKFETTIPEFSPTIA